LVAVGVVLGALLSGTGGGEDGGRDADAAGPPGSVPTVSSGGTATSDRSAPGCTAHYRVVNSWPGGYQAEVTVRTSGQAPLSGWSVRWTPPPGHGISQVWNGALTRDGAEVVVRDAGWNAVVEPGRTADFGFLVRTPDRTAVAPDTPDGLTCE
ncbi:cellulose binding domain-containing protein, partial [Saccharomonospora iraqiensis]|uniref:cellulose binding domain-containing protein n=1 Tax=Saccharomonospora iraqiensis TaxID=52698 RepID=UPI001F38B209